MKIYHLEINSPVSIEKYCLYSYSEYTVNSIGRLQQIHFTDSYSEIRMIMDLHGLKVDSIKIYRDKTFPDYPKTHKIKYVVVGLKKDE